MKREKGVIPEFKSLEEEKAYWEARGPLAEGHKGKINKPRPQQKRSSFLSVRLTGEELTQLRDMASSFGIGPSTYTRQLIRLTIEQFRSFLPFQSPAPPPYIFWHPHDPDEAESPQSIDEFLGRAQKAYIAYLEAQKDVWKTYQEKTSAKSEKKETAK